MIRTRIFVRLCPACPPHPAMRPCPGVSALSGQTVKCLKSNGKLGAEFVSALRPAGGECSRTRFFVRPCPACPVGPDTGVCPALSGLSGQAVKCLILLVKRAFLFVSALRPDMAARRYVDRTRRGNGFPPLGGEPSLPRDTPGHFPVVRNYHGGRVWL